MKPRKAQARWTGTLKDGTGQLATESELCTGPYSFSSRFEEGKGTNPEELIGAAYAGCFSQAFSLELEKAGFAPKEVKTQAEVRLEKQGDGFAITHIQLKTEGSAEGIDAAKFEEIANAAKDGCPVGKALSAVAKDVEVKLI